MVYEGKKKQNNHGLLGVGLSGFASLLCYYKISVPPGTAYTTPYFCQHTVFHVYTGIQNDSTRLLSELMALA